MKRVLVSGSDGFLGRNLIKTLEVDESISVITWSRNTDSAELLRSLENCDVVVHLAATNRSHDLSEFERTNVDLTQYICEHLSSHNPVPIVFTSSTQVGQSNPYGRSKLAAENIVLEYGRNTGQYVHVLRLPNVFGKWCKPHYNSVVATFCHQIARGEEISITDENAVIELVHVDDVVNLIGELVISPENRWRNTFENKYRTTLGQLAKNIKDFSIKRKNNEIPEVGHGFLRALYSTYISYLPHEDFSYPLNPSVDQRGLFVEFLKTSNNGQLSFLTAHSGVTRGSHYHHTKVEKFVVLSGRARFRFRHLVTTETVEIFSDFSELKVVESIPGWVHDITNVGDELLIVALWANEVFDYKNQDTYAELV